MAGQGNLAGLLRFVGGRVKGDSFDYIHQGDCLHSGVAGE